MFTLITIREDRITELESRHTKSNSMVIKTVHTYSTSVMGLVLSLCHNRVLSTAVKSAASSVAYQIAALALSFRGYAF